MSKAFGQGEAVPIPLSEGRIYNQMSASIFSVKGLRIYRDGQMITKALNFSLGQGHILNIVGANGSGKSSLLRVLAGLSRHYRGRILWRTNTIADREENHRRNVAYLAHGNGMKRDLTAKHNLDLWRALLSAKTIEEEPESDAPIGFKNPGKWRKSPLFSLSTGQQRRAAIERILCLQNRPLWVLDEPHTNLDPATCAMLDDRIRHYSGNGGIVIFSSQTPSGLKIRHIDMDGHTDGPMDGPTDGASQ